MDSSNDSVILGPGEPGGSPSALPAPRAVVDQATQNRSTANQWGLYGSHRRALERLLVPAQRGTDRLCVVGAGNCNDLDLRWLVEAYREVHLVDIDPMALSGAVGRQKVSDVAGLHRHAPVDLTGAAAEIGRWPLAPPSDAEVDALARRLAEGPALPLPGPFDVVLSPCVLTQIISPARKALGNEHSRFPALRLAMRDGHLRSIAKLLRPGGRAVLAIDLISSTAFKGLPRVPEAELPGLMDAMVRRNKTYCGLDPASLTAAVRGNPSLRAAYSDPVFSAPWHWHLSLQRTFLVYGVVLQKV